MTCACPDGYPRTVEYGEATLPRGMTALAHWIRVVKHTGPCDRHDELQVRDMETWRTVWGGD